MFCYATAVFTIKIWPLHSVQETKIRKNYNKIANIVVILQKVITFAASMRVKVYRVDIFFVDRSCGYGVIGSHVRLRI